MTMNFVSNCSGHVATATAPRHRHLFLYELAFRWRHLLAIKQRGAARRSSCAAHAGGADANVDADATRLPFRNADDAAGFSVALCDGASVRADTLASASSSGAGASSSSNDNECSAADASAAPGSPVDPAAPKASSTDQAERRRARGSYKLAKQAR